MWLFIVSCFDYIHVPGVNGDTSDTDERILFRCLTHWVWVFEQRQHQRQQVSDWTVVVHVHMVVQNFTSSSDSSEMWHRKLSFVLLPPLEWKRNWHDCYRHHDRLSGGIILKSTWWVYFQLKEIISLRSSSQRNHTSNLRCGIFFTISSTLSCRQE